MKIINFKARKVLLILCFILSISSLRLLKKESKHKLKTTKEITSFIPIKFQDVKDINEKIVGKEEKGFYDISLLIHIIEITKISNFLNDAATINVPDKNSIFTKFKYTCLSSEIYEADLKSSDWMNEDDKRKFAQHEVFRKCFKRKYKCNSLDLICFVKHIASHLNQEFIILDQKAKVHELKLTDFEEDKSDVDLKEKVMLAILYQSNTAYSIKTRNGLINKNTETSSKEIPFL